jgi:hypothetical protein
MKRRRKTIITSFTILLVACAVFWFFIFPFLTVRTPLAYPMLRRLWKAEAIAHFPGKMAGGNEATGFYFNAGALQAETGMELRLRFDRMDYTRELRRLQEFSITEEGKEFSQMYDKNWFWTARDDAFKFQVRVLHCRPTFYGEELSWNHGSGYGYAWNEQDREVIYWTSSW